MIAGIGLDARGASHGATTHNNASTIATEDGFAAAERAGEQFRL